MKKRNIIKPNFVTVLDEIHNLSDVTVVLFKLGELMVSRHESPQWLFKQVRMRYKKFSNSDEYYKLASHVSGAPFKDVVSFYKYKQWKNPRVMN